MSGGLAHPRRVTTLQPGHLRWPPDNFSRRSALEPRDVGQGMACTGRGTLQRARGVQCGEARDRKPRTVMRTTPASRARPGQAPQCPGAAARRQWIPMRCQWRRPGRPTRGLDIPAASTRRTPPGSGTAPGGRSSLKAATAILTQIPEWPLKDGAQLAVNWWRRLSGVVDEPRAHPSGGARRRRRYRWPIDATGGRGDGT